jgi:outer membrane protein assembly factor BamD (BamD/ComL family)
MLKYKIFLSTMLFACAMVMVSCGPSREKAAGQIRSLETTLFSQQSGGFDQGKADTLLSLYVAFVAKNPKDSLSPGFLFKAANLAMNSENGPRALELFDQYMKDYPDQPKASLCLFFKAFIYENKMKNLDKARETYLLFIEKYPNDDFANDAKLAIVNLGKTPEMIIREFEAKNRADSLRVADSLANAGKTKKGRKS